MTPNERKSPPAAGEPPVDFEQLQRRLRRRPRTSCRTWPNLYFDQAGEIMPALAAALEKHSASDIDYLAHKLAGASLSCGMSAMVAPLRELEKRGRSGDLAGADEFMAQAAANLEIVRAALQDYLRRDNRGLGASPSVGRILFIAGTGTGVGKTVLTALLLHHLRREGHRRPGRETVLLRFARRRPPPAPAANRGPHPAGHQPVLLPASAGAVGGGAGKRRGRRFLCAMRWPPSGAPANAAKSCSWKVAVAFWLRWADNYATAELISRLGCQTVIVAPNCLGTINHSC